MKKLDLRLESDKRLQDISYIYLRRFKHPPAQTSSHWNPTNRDGT